MPSPTQWRACPGSAHGWASRMAVAIPLGCQERSQLGRVDNGILSMLFLSLAPPNSIFLGLTRGSSIMECTARALTFFLKVLPGSPILSPSEQNSPFSCPTAPETLGLDPTHVATLVCATDSFSFLPMNRDSVFQTKGYFPVRARGRPLDGGKWSFSRHMCR